MTKHTQTPFKITASYPLNHESLQTLTLLYMPIIGQDAYTLYVTLYTLLDRARLKSPEYPLDFLLDMLNLTPQSLLETRKKLEAAGLLETFKHDDNHFLFELYLPLTPEGFIKDSPLASYLNHAIGSYRFKDLVEHFKITRVQKSNYQNISVAFNDVFAPIEDHTTLKSQFMDTSRQAVKFNTAFEADIVLEAIPNALMHPKMKTKRAKQKLQEIAYLYDLNETTMQPLVLKCLTERQTLDFNCLTEEAQSMYQKIPKKQLSKRSGAYDLDYFQSVHPKTMLEDLSGKKAPVSELKVIERLMQESQLKNEVINVMIAYVLKELNNQFPVYNYFDKITAEWHRNNIDTAEKAVEYIKTKIKKKNQPKKSYRKPYKKERTDTEVDWFDSYLKKQAEDVKE